MNNHVGYWLGAYLDGEVRATERKRIEAHLANCAECRAELEALRQLSRRLHKSPLPESATPAGRFAAQVALQLPPRTAKAKHTQGIGWELALLGAVLALSIFQIITGLGTLLSLGSQSGLLTGFTEPLALSPSSNVWLSILAFVTQGSAERNSTLLQALYQLDAWLSPLANGLAWQGRIVALYWAGLILWWIHQSREASPRSTSSI